MSHYDETKNRFNPCNRFIGDIENGLRYPFACYTKEESDERYAKKTTETDLSALESSVSALQSDVATKASSNDLIAVIDVVNTKADKTTMQLLEAQINELSQRISALEKSIVIQTFEASPAIIEIGSDSTIDLVWSLNKAAVTQSINGEPVMGTTKQYTNVSATTSYTLVVTDSYSTTNKTVTVEAANQIYYGAAANLSNVSTLTKVLSNDKTRTITVNAGAGQYIVYAYPARLGDVTFFVGAWEGGFEPPVELNLTNASGYTEKYKVFRSTNANLGETTVDIKEG